MLSHKPQSGAQLTYCFCDFHPGHEVTVQDIGGVGYIFCVPCHKLGHIDLVGHRVTMDECKVTNG